MDKHLAILTKQHMETKFIKVSAHMHTTGGACWAGGQGGNDGLVVRGT